MNAMHLAGFALVVCMFLWSSDLLAQGKLLPPTPAEGKEEPKQKEKDQKPPEKKIVAPPETDVFSRVLVPRAEAPSGYNPHMLGDWSNKFARRQTTVVATQTTVVKETSTGLTLNTTTRTTTQTRTVLVPLPNHGAFKVAENASPRPIDRVFAFYNFYDGLRGPTAAGNGLERTVTEVRSGRTVDTTTTTTLLGGPSQQLHREVFGFEKTFLNGDASIELRVPVMQQTLGGPAYAYDHMGDLTIVTKYALVNDRVTGDVLSGGLAITVPTSPRLRTTEGDFRTVLLQPWFGYILNGDRFFFQAFHSIVVPTDDRDVTLAFNDLALNYWLYRNEQGNGFVNFVVPSFEAHVTTPLKHRDFATAPVVVMDAVVLTGGIHFGLGRGSVLSFATGVPVTGPRPFSVEAFVQFNRRF
jgi:hypothetical protein